MTDSVTISLLPVTLSLVHVPRSRLDTLSHHILRQILLPNPTFFNVTCNEIELSVFAEHHALADLELLASRDARKVRLRDRQGHKRRLREDWEPIEMSSDRWNVLQIDSHSDRQENSGARVHELSAPLAAAGISILYQSSYMSDFIFVKDFRLSEVMSLLASAGFDLYSSDPNNLTSQLSTFTSPLLSPVLTGDDTSVNMLDLNAPVFSQTPVQIPGRTSIDAENGAVFSRSRSSTGTTRSSSSSDSRASAFDLIPTMGAGTSDDISDEDIENTPAPSRPPLARSQSHSPSSCDVRALPPDLTLVGLADDSAETWGLKIVKLVAFPELIPGIARASRSSVSDMGRDFASRLSEHGDTAAGALRIFTGEDEPGLEAGNASGSDTTTRVGPDSPKKDASSVRSGSESPLFDVASNPLDGDIDEDNDADDDDEAYDTDESSDDESFSAEADTTPPAVPEGATRPPFPEHNRRSQHRHQHTTRPSDDSVSFSDEPAPGLSRSDSPCAPLSPPPLVPFFSFTRTAEGSSLTAPVSILAKLFPAHERHMVMCSDELDILDSRVGSPSGRDESDDNEQDEFDDDRDERGVQGPLRCLQIDLRKFGLDKHGLVNRFSRTLEENGVNHMYSSTFKTANLLVAKADAGKAQSLLRSC